MHERFTSSLLCGIDEFDGLHDMRKDGIRAIVLDVLDVEDLYVSESLLEPERIGWSPPSCGGIRIRAALLLICGRDQRRFANGQHMSDAELFQHEGITCVVEVAEVEMVENSRRKVTIEALIVEPAVR